MVQVEQSLPLQVKACTACGVSFGYFDTSTQTLQQSVDTVTACSTVQYFKGPGLCLPLTSTAQALKRSFQLHRATK